MKPGSTEIVRRPICIHEHLPTMFPEKIGKYYIHFKIIYLNYNTTFFYLIFKYNCYKYFNNIIYNCRGKYNAK